MYETFNGSNAYSLNYNYAIKQCKAIYKFNFKTSI